jgi:hypothetical protein
MRAFEQRAAAGYAAWFFSKKKLPLDALRQEFLFVGQFRNYNGLVFERL